jgi:hypothetical protein
MKIVDENVGQGEHDYEPSVNMMVEISTEMATEMLRLIDIVGKVEESSLFGKVFYLAFTNDAPDWYTLLRDDDDDFPSEDYPGEPNKQYYDMCPAVLLVYKNSIAWRAFPNNADFIVECQEIGIDTLRGIAGETTEPELIPGDFTSNWDEGSLSTRAMLNPKTGEITSDEIVIKGDLGSLISENFSSDDGSIYGEVCLYCHEYLLKTFMVSDNVGKGLHEEQRCPQCEQQNLVL